MTSEDATDLLVSGVHRRLYLAEYFELYKSVPGLRTSAVMGAVERAVLEAHHPCKEQRGLLGELRRRVRILAFQYSVTVGTSVMLTEEAICVHIFLLLLLASIGYGLYAQCYPLISTIAG